MAAKDLLKGFDRKKLMCVEIRWGDSDKALHLGEFGDCTVMSGFSRLGGRFREWDRARDDKDFSPQQIDGGLTRQSVGSARVRQDRLAGQELLGR